MNTTIRSEYIYFIGIAGTAMASAAHALKSLGYRVGGSDRGIYPPMSDFLRARGIEYCSSFSAENLTPTPDVVVVGNAISRGNPELEEVLNRKIPYTSLPQMVNRRLIGTKESIVVTGTHGKTTTTSLLAWILETAKRTPGFLIGGIPKNFDEGCRAGEGKVFVTEGDEYDTAFFDKRSKFLHYAPDTVIINNIEFDHADIFSSLGEIKKSFSQLVNLVPENGCIVVNADDANVQEVIANAYCTIESYGISEKADWRWEVLAASEDGMRYELFHHGERYAEFHIPMSGVFNIYNSVAAVIVAIRCGAASVEIQNAFTSFQGVKRRMEIIAEKDGTLVIDDFAHHPTAIRETMRAIRIRYPERRIVALFEPRSNTTTRNIFQKELTESLALADVALIGALNRAERYPEEERLAPEKMVAALRAQGREVEYLPVMQELYSHVTKILRTDDVILFLSNGDFGGVKERVVEFVMRRIKSSPGI